MEIKQTIEKIKKQAEEFGMLLKDSESGRKKQNAVWRNNTKEITSNSNAYFGIIREGEAPSQSYSDLSLVFFPSFSDNSKILMALTVGSEGFRNDYEIAIQPGLRRSFSKLLPPKDHIIFCKRDFADISKKIDVQTDGFSVDRYLQFMLVGVVVNTDLRADWEIINGWIARYAHMRSWDDTNQIKKRVNEAIQKARVEEKEDHLKTVKDLLYRQKYVVLEGAPGVGKTHTASKLAEDFHKVFFTQFHAGTTYADFVYGILPKLGSEEIIYESREGKFLEALAYATKNPHEDVLLIIDEINRANLASVLGEVFYLFEPKRELVPNYEIAIGDQKFKEMPKNLFVLGTMNTADRSLAVVDYALRRRFSWYKIKPEAFDNLNKRGKELFDEMARIFEDYATDMELNLQPGASYFLGTEEELDSRLRFELMPLIKEYLLNGLMTQAEQPLDDYFFTNIHKRIFN